MDVPLLDYLSSMSPNRAGRIGLAVWQRNGLKVSGHHPTFYMSQAIRWGQGCSRSNKAGSHCITSSFFARYKPDPLISLPISVYPLTHRQSMRWARRLMMTSVLSHPLWHTSWVVHFELIWLSECPPLLRGWLRQVLPKSYRLYEGIRFVSSKKKKKKKKDVLKQFSVVFRNNRKSL